MNKNIFQVWLEKEKVQNFMEDQLKKGYIRPSKSPQISPVFFVSKKNREKRIAIDYCNLNDQMLLLSCEDL